MNARQRFERTRKAVERFETVHNLLMYGGDDWKPESVRVSGEKSDPTASRAIYNVDELADKLDGLRKEETELVDIIGETLAIIAAIKSSFGEIYATLLEARYIDLLTWPQIATDYGISKSSGHYLINIAFDYVDSIGVSRLLAGDADIQR